MSEQFMTFSGPTIEIPPPNSIVIDMTKLDEICERAQGDGGGMRQTDRLRELLTERGAKWFDADGRVVIGVDEPATVASFKDYDGLLLGMMYTCCTPEQAVEATLGPAVSSPDPPDVPYDILIDELRDTWDIDASWDGLRRFWSIGLTEDGCLMRDRACKAEAENAKLRELVRDMWHEGMCECGSRGKCASCEYDYPTRMRELGIEVDE